MMKNLKRVLSISLLSFAIAISTICIVENVKQNEAIANMNTTYVVYYNSDKEIHLIEGKSVCVNEAGVFISRQSNVNCCMDCDGKADHYIPNESLIRVSKR